VKVKHKLKWGKRSANIQLYISINTICDKSFILADFLINSGLIFYKKG